MLSFKILFWELSVTVWTEPTVVLPVRTVEPPVVAVAAPYPVVLPPVVLVEGVNVELELEAAVLVVSVVVEGVLVVVVVVAAAPQAVSEIAHKAAASAQVTCFRIVMEHAPSLMLHHIMVVLSILPRSAK